MSLNYGYLCSTKEVAKDFSKYDNFLKDKKFFESVPNVNISRSIDTNSQPLDPPQVGSSVSPLTRGGWLISIDSNARRSSTASPTLRIGKTRWRHRLELNKG